MDATQPVVYEYDTDAARPVRFVVTVELALYLALALLALVLRIAELDTVPMTEVEARQALAAWRFVEPQAAGQTIAPNSPLLFLLHTMTFSLLGASEFTARVLTALAGVCLAVSPALFRDLLGRGQALVFSLVLSLSPVLLVTSRMDSPVVWTVLTGVFGLWCLWRYWQTQQGMYGVLAIVSLVSVILLTDPTGPVFALILLGGFAFALWRTPAEADETDLLTRVRARLAGWPWLVGFLVATMIVVLVSTVFLTTPQGLSSVAALLGEGAQGLVSAPQGAPAFYPLLITLFYEPVLVVLAVSGLIWLGRGGWLTFIDRFLLGWLLVAAAVSILYTGAGADHALWLVLPLAGLTARTAVELMRDPDRLIWYTPRWVKWVLALIMVGLLFVMAVHAQALGRALLTSPDGSIQLNQIDARSAIWLLVGTLFIITGYFMAGSVWGAGTAARGWALGLLGFGLLTGVGSGWNAAVFDSENPAQLWTLQATSRETWLLRDTLAELARRESNGFPDLPVTVLAPDDGVLAWLVRDYTDARFVQSVGEAQGHTIVLLPQLSEPPNLGGNYLGQRFVITKGWSYASVRPVDFLAWWSQRRTLAEPAPVLVYVLWLREDIYQGVPFDIEG